MALWPVPSPPCRCKPWLAATWPPLPLEELQQLAAVFGMVKSDYVEPVDEKKLITEAISGMVASLDPHSQYFDKKSFKEFSEGTSGRFVGVGIEISQEDGLVKIVTPIEGSPADRAGLKTNDLITKVDDTPLKGLSLSEAVKRMRGEPKTKVVLTVFRKDENRTFPVTIIREEIKTQSVKSKLIEPGYGWIRVSQFQERTVEDFARKIEDMYKQDPQLKGLVLMVDIRRGLTKLDIQMINWFTQLAKPIHVLLTKSDKLNRADVQKKLGEVSEILVGQYSQVTVQVFSSLNRAGLDEARAKLIGWLS